MEGDEHDESEHEETEHVSSEQKLELLEESAFDTVHESGSCRDESEVPSRVESRPTSPEVGIRQSRPQSRDPTYRQGLAMGLAMPLPAIDASPV